MPRQGLTKKRPLLEPKRNPGSPPGKGTPPAFTLKHWMRQQWAAAQPNGSGLVGKTLRFKSQMDTANWTAVWPAQRMLSCPSSTSLTQKNRPDSCPSQLQILSFYDCQGHSELQTDTILKNGFGTPRGRNGNPLWYSCLENPMARGAWSQRRPP